MQHERLRKEERDAYLHRAAADTRMQAAQIDNHLNQMDNQAVLDYMNTNPDLVEFNEGIVVDDTPNTIVVNYANQPNNTQEISISPPWEMNFSAGAAGQVNLFQVGAPANSGMSFYNPYAMKQDDERMKQYTPGMKIYGLQPYQFITAEQMVETYEALEKQRKEECDRQYFFAKMQAKMNPDNPSLAEYAETLKFKPADEVYKDRMEEQKRQQEEMEREEKELYDDNDIIYDRYDASGNKYIRKPNIKIVDNEGNVVFQTNNPKDKHGVSYGKVNIQEERARAYKEQKLQMELYKYQKVMELYGKALQEQYEKNMAKWKAMDEAGCSLTEKMIRYEDDRIDWEHNGKVVDRMMRAGSYSRKTFRSIMDACYNTEIDYMSRSKVFSLSYDFERDLHYKSLISTPEEMSKDPLVKQKLSQEFELKRALFLNKLQNNNTMATDVSLGATDKPALPKPNIYSLTLDDYKKPENQIMYSQMDNHALSTQNMFIPNVDSPPQIVVPEKRTLGTVHFDEATGQTINTESIVDVNGMTQEQMLSKFF